MGMAQVLLGVNVVRVEVLGPHLVEKGEDVALVVEDHVDLAVCVDVCEVDQGYFG